MGGLSQPVFMLVAASKKVKVTRLPQVVGATTVVLVMEHLQAGENKVAQQHWSVGTKWMLHAGHTSTHVAWQCW